MEFSKRFLRKRLALFKSGQCHFHQDNTPVHNSILFTDYLIKMGIKTVTHPPSRPCSLRLLLIPLAQRLSLCFLEMKVAVKKVIDTLTQKVFPGAFEKLLYQQVHCSRRRLLRRVSCVLSIKVPMRVALVTLKCLVIWLPRAQVALGAHCLGCELHGVQIALVTLNVDLLRCLRLKLLWVPIALGASCYGANCLGYFKYRVILLPRVQVALGAHCLGCEMLQ